MGAECPYAFINGERNMAKITKKQLDAIDGMCRNGFSFDMVTDELVSEMLPESVQKEFRQKIQNAHNPNSHAAR